MAQALAVAFGVVLVASLVLFAVSVRRLLREARGREPSGGGEGGGERAGPGEEAREPRGELPPP